MGAKNTILGVGVLVSGAICAWLLGEVLPWPNPLLIAVVIGVLFSNTVGVPKYVEQGVETHENWLRGGIVLMGASVSLGALIKGGPVVLALVSTVVVITMVLFEIVGRYTFSIDNRLSSLLAAGTSICGVSAVAAVAGSIGADEETIAYAAGTILLFDAVTLAIYPLVGSVIAIPDQVFGVWAGVSMFSTGPVVAAGFVHSEVAGQWATVTKLIRNSLIGLVVLIYATYYARKGPSANAEITTLLQEFPNFVFGFFIMAFVASTGVLSAGQVTTIENASNWLFLIAFVGLGAELQRSVFAKVGFRPIAAVFLTWSAVASGTLSSTWLLFG